jgi:subtilisin family serine protease
MKNKTISVTLATLLVSLPVAYRTSFAQELNQQVPLSWGLDRIDQRSQELDDNYQYLYDGSGVDIYVLDSGINTMHTDFEGRIQAGASYTSDTVEDCNGHGTHVAGIAAGSTHGVAKGANIIPVKVLNCANVGSFFDVVNAINWVIEHHDSSNVAVMNLSFVTERNDSLNNLIARAYADNIIVVVGAGNNTADVANYSPASEPTALTVAGATIGTSSGNGILPASNYGSLVDLYAPSSYITSAWIGSSTASRSRSGTSQAAPFVAGVAALAIQQYPSMSAEDIINLIVDSATDNAMSSVPSDTVNKLVYSLLNNEIESSVTTTTTTTELTTTTTSTTTIPPTTTTTILETTTTTTTVPETTTTVPETTTTTTTIPETTTTTTVSVTTSTQVTTTTVYVSAPQSQPSESSGGSQSEDNDQDYSSSDSPTTTTTSTTSTTSTTVLSLPTTTTVAPTVSLSPVEFKHTIKCRKFNKRIKGKLIVNVTSVNPKCPKGYRINLKSTSSKVKRIKLVKK